MESIGIQYYLLHKIWKLIKFSVKIDMKILEIYLLEINDYNHTLLILVLFICVLYLNYLLRTHHLKGIV